MLTCAHSGDVITFQGYPVVIDAAFSSPPVLRADAASVTLEVLHQAGGSGSDSNGSGGGNSGRGRGNERGKYLISGIPKGGSAILHLANTTSFVVSAVPGNKADYNYYGYKPRL